MDKYDYRLVSRPSLGELEKAVLTLRNEGWDLEMQEASPTICEALADLHPVLNKRAGGMSSLVCVAMKRKKSPEGEDGANNKG